MISNMRRLSPQSTASSTPFEPGGRGLGTGIFVPPHGDAYRLEAGLLLGVEIFLFGRWVVPVALVWWFEHVAQVDAPPRGLLCLLRGEPGVERWKRKVQTVINWGRKSFFVRYRPFNK